MNPPRRPARRRRSQALASAVAALLATAVLAAGCASFPDSAPTFTVQPSLRPNEATLVTPTPLAGSSSRTSPSPSPSSGTPSSPASSTPASTPADPCAPTDPAVIATCLTTPWGLAPLPDGQSALVGERTTGKILTVAAGRQPELLTTITGLDTSGGGGLLGIALSPYYTEDNLIYAYVSTAKDNRILRIAPGQAPKAIFTGIPRGDEHNGGPIAFGADRMLYVATGDTGDPATARDRSSLAGKVLRLDAFGKPATGNPGGSAIYASGFSDPTGICPLPGGPMGALDHRSTGDLLIPVHSGKDYSTTASGDTLWIYQAGDGGAADCAVSAGYLLSSSLEAKKVTSIQMTPSGGFTGSPQDLIPDEYGRLLTVVTGPGDLVWLTTSNKDGHGTPIPSDDRVIVLPAAGGGGGGGGPD
jgi:glucose/arabinose dehydrogenase